MLCDVAQLGTHLGTHVEASAQIEAAKRVDEANDHMNSRAWEFRRSKDDV